MARIRRTLAAATLTIALTGCESVQEVSQVVAPLLEQTTGNYSTPMSQQPSEPFRSHIALLHMLE